MSHAPEAAPANVVVPTARLGCGQTALMAVAQAHGDKTASKLRSLLTENQAVKNAVTSFYDLANWARASGMKPMGLKIDSTDLAELPLPAVVHVRPDHFLALMAVDNERIVIVDEGGLQYEILRQDFERRFTGHVLCFKKFLGPRG